MKNAMRHAAGVGALAAAAILIGASASATGRGYGRMGGPAVPPGANRIVYGETRTVGGATAYTWARVNVQGKVQEVGVSIPRSLIWNPSHGAGPLGAFLSLDFPDIVKDTTFLDNFQTHWEPGGHPPDIYAAPHFDFHFYGIPESSIWGIAPPDTRAPDANQVPAGYIFPGVEATVPMMGTHALNAADFTRPFNATMVMGYWHGNLIFIEPMITRAQLLSSPNITMAVPRPQYLYRETEYPAVFSSRYNQRSGAYELTLRGFSTIHTPTGD